MSSFLFYLFSLGMALFGMMSIILKNNVHKVLSLIGVFFFVACLTLMINFEFVATMLIVVYMGAIAMLFLFVIMLIGQEDYTMQKISTFNILVSALFGYLLFNILNYSIMHKIQLHKDISILNLGKSIYHTHSKEFLFISVVLFLGLISAILLTIKYKFNLNKNTITSRGKTRFVTPNINSGIKI